MQSKSYYNRTQSKGFPLIGSPLRTVRKLFGKKEYTVRKTKYTPEDPFYIRSGEFSAITLDDMDDIAQ
jgi:hypothetical protein